MVGGEATEIRLGTNPLRLAGWDGQHRRSYDEREGVMSGVKHFGWWSMFEDPEGTRFALGEWGASEGRNRDG